MKAFIKVEYSSEGKTPAEIQMIFEEAGFRKIEGAPVFEISVASESEFNEKLVQLHQSLRNAGVIYVPSMTRPAEAPQAKATNYRERMELWRVLGINVDELLNLLEIDVEKFRARAVELVRAEIDRIAAQREKELREIQERELIEKTKSKIVESARVEGGQTFNDLLRIVGIDEDMLSHMIDELVEKGRIKAEQRGRKVVYVAS